MPPTKLPVNSAREAARKAALEAVIAALNEAL